VSLVVHGTATATTADAVGLGVAIWTSSALPLLKVEESGRLVLEIKCRSGIGGQTYRLPKELVPLAIQLLVHHVT
jgi:hypothetical protein